MDDGTVENIKPKRKLKMPTTAALLMIMILVATILTYIIPAGEYERVLDESTGRTLVLPGTYSNIEQTPVGFGGLLSSIFKGLVNASDIIAFVFVVGGAFSVVKASGSINAGLNKLIKNFNGKEGVLIAIVMIAFSIGGATFGMAEETLPFITILVATSIALGYDAIVGIAMVVIGLYCGYSAGPLNPFNTGIAQGIAELPIFSGLGLRIVLMLGSLVIAIHHTIRYAKKVKNNKIEKVINKNDMEVQDLDLKMTTSRKIILTILALSLVVLVVGVLKLDWYFAEISALFMLMGLIVGMIAFKGNFNKFTDEFLKGAVSMTTAAIFIGLSRAILVVLQDGNIMDTIVYGLAIPLKKLNSIFAAWGMYIVQGFINFAIPSSTGQAVVVMPVMSSLSDIIGTTRQVAVLAYQAGDGYWNMITPTHPVVMASIGLASITFDKWFKFAFPLVLKWTVWVMCVLAFAVVTGWGPF